MYERKLDDKVLTFGHAGLLYKRSFVMYDHQTDSLWVHATGRAERGPLRGRQLTFMPSTVTSWQEWKTRYPGTLVLPGHRRGGFMGTYEGIGYGRHIGLAVVLRFKAKLYPFRELEISPVVNDNFNGQDILIFYSEKAGTATAWHRELDGKPLRFTLARASGSQAPLKDDRTGSRWDWLSGQAESGALAGRKLKQLQYNPILVDRFRAFYPGAPEFSAAQPAN